MIKIKEADTHLRGNYKEYVGDFLRLLIALDNNPIALLAFEKAIDIFQSGSYEVSEDYDESGQSTTFVCKPSEKENVA